MSELQRLASIPSDINEHLHTMNRYAASCSHITEMGVRDIVSTWSWLEAKPTKLVCYDVALPPQDRFNQVVEYTKQYNIDFVFHQADVLSVEIEPTELLFIDTVHTHEQLISELRLHSGKVSKYIVLHDTEGFGEVGIDQYGKETLGLRYAVQEFLAENPNWAIELEHKNCFGLTILKRS